MELVAWITDERRRVARLVEGLSPPQLSTPSLCAGWTVREVAAHVLSPLVVTTPRRMLVTAVSGFQLDRANLRLTASLARWSTEAIIDGLRRHATDPPRPSGASPAAVLTDLLVHQQDIRRPLGLRPDLDPQRVQIGLEFLRALAARTGRRGPVLAAPGSFTGLRWQAMDLDWAWGEGPVVRAPAEALLMMLSGRWSAIVELDGDGVQTLRARRPGPGREG